MTTCLYLFVYCLTILSISSVYYATPESLVFNRVDVVNDIHKHVFIKIYGHSRQSVLMYTMVLFRSPLRQIVGFDANTSDDHYHNALLIGSHTYQQYYKITKDSKFVYNNEIPLVARGVNFMMPFSVIAQRSDWNAIAKTSYTESSSGAKLDSVDVYDIMAMDATGSSASTYHAILSLDKDSSIWDLYNVMTLSPYQMMIRYEPSGLVSDTVGEYDGIVKLTCTSVTVDDDRCMIVTGQLILGGVVYNSTTYRLIIDLHSAANYLPTHLYFHIQSLSSSKQSILIDNGLPLSNNFKYLLNEYDNDVIIGVDLLRLFPKVEYSVESGQINLWYYVSTQIHNEVHEAVAITMTVLLVICLLCYFEYISSEPGALFNHMIRHSHVTRKWFYFSVRQTIVEVVILILSFIIMTLTLLFVDYNASQRFQRTFLFAILTFYHITILCLVHFVTPQVTKQAFKYYFTRNRKQQQQLQSATTTTTTLPSVQSLLTRDFLGTHSKKAISGNNNQATGGDTTIPDRDFEEVKSDYIEEDLHKLSKEKTINVIARNTCLINLIMLSIMMKINFSSDESYLYILLLFGLALIYLYFAVHCVALGWLYWFTFTQRQTPRSYLLFICGELLSLLFYIGWATSCIYLDYFHAINSIYSETFVVSVTLVLVSFVVLFGCRAYQNKMDDLIQAHYID